MTYFKETGIKDINTGKQLWVDEFHTIRASDLVRLIGTTFIGATKDTNFWTETAVGTGSVTQSGGTVVLATGATANSTIQYQTARLARWVPGAENTHRTILKLGDTGTANNIRNWGAFDANNGFFFQLSGTTLNIVSRSGGADTAVAKASWNVNTTFTVDTNIHKYDIRMTYAAVYFYIDDVLVHVIQNSGSSTFPTQTLNLPISLQNNNSGGSTSNVSMTVGVSFITRTGKLETDSKFLNIVAAGTYILKYGAGRLHKVIIGTTGGTSVQMFDNTAASGTSMGTLTTANAPITIDFACPFFTGLTVLATGTVSVTVVYE
jgi:hypothetical protein